MTSNNSRIDEIFSGKQLLVAEFKGDKIIIIKGLFTFNYDTYVNSEGKNKVVKYDFTKQSFLEYIDKGKLKILDETI